MKSITWPSFVMSPLAAALLLASTEALATGPATPIDAGSLLQELQPSLKQAPTRDQTDIRIESKESDKLPPSPPFLVKAIRITGNSVFETSVLHALVADEEGKTLTLPELGALTSRITKYYQDRGYPLARAVIPAQTISDGTVVIQMVEARYGKVRLNNSSQVNGSLLESILSPLQEGLPVSEEGLDHALLVLSDVPGVGVNAVLKPGQDVGTSDLDIDATPKTFSIGNLAIDNFGNRYIGRTRFSGAASWFNPLHRGDILSANLISTGERLAYGRVSYETLLNGTGTRVGSAYSMVHYKLGDSISALDAHGTAAVASVWLRHPLIRSKQTNLYGQIQYDTKTLKDHIDASGVRTDRHLDNWVLSLSGDIRDSLLGGAVSAWSAGWTVGRVSFDDATAASSDVMTAGTRGGFSKWNINFSRLQSLGSKDSLYVNVAVQWSDSNLDSAEKMSVGGPYSVRAYESGAVSGDTGYFGSIEFRHDMGRIANGSLQALAFVDSARININRHPWTTGKNSADLSGAGLGLQWNTTSLWSLSAYVATKIGSSHSSLVASSASTRAWLVLSKGF